MVALVAAVLLSVAAPPPDAPLPTGAAAIARDLATTTEAVHAAVDGWREEGTARQPRELRLWALHQQRLYLALGLARPAIGDRVVALLPAALRPEAQEVLVARRSLVRLTSPTTRPL